MTIAKLFSGINFQSKVNIMPFPEDVQPISIGTLELPPIYSNLPVSPQDH